MQLQHRRAEAHQQTRPLTFLEENSTKSDRIQLFFCTDGGQTLESCTRACKATWPPPVFKSSNFRRQSSSNKKAKISSKNCRFLQKNLRWRIWVLWYQTWDFFKNYTCTMWSALWNRHAYIFTSKNLIYQKEHVCTRNPSYICQKRLFLDSLRWENSVLKSPTVSSALSTQLCSKTSVL